MIVEGNKAVLVPILTSTEIIRGQNFRFILKQNIGIVRKVAIVKKTAEKFKTFVNMFRSKYQKLQFFHSLTGVTHLKMRSKLILLIQNLTEKRTKRRDCKAWFEHRLLIQDGEIFVSIE